MQVDICTSILSNFHIYLLGIWHVFTRPSACRYNFMDRGVIKWNWVWKRWNIKLGAGLGSRRKYPGWEDAFHKCFRYTKKTIGANSRLSWIIELYWYKFQFRGKWSDIRKPKSSSAWHNWRYPWVVWRFHELRYIYLLPTRHELNN